MDNYRSHADRNFLTLLWENGFIVLKLPANCTCQLQPLDLSFNHALKDVLRQEFISYQATEIAQQIKNGVEAPKLDLRLAKIKPLHAQWLIRAFDNLRSRPKTVTDGWQMAGITQALIDKAQIFQKNRKHC